MRLVAVFMLLTAFTTVVVVVHARPMGGTGMHPPSVDRRKMSRSSLSAPLSLVDAVLVPNGSVQPQSIAAALDVTIEAVYARSLNRWTVSEWFPADPTIPVIVINGTGGGGGGANACTRLSEPLSSDEQQVFDSSTESFEWCSFSGDASHGRTGPVVYVYGASLRAILYGLADLARTMAVSGQLSYVASFSAPYKAYIALPSAGMHVQSSPAYPLRGHQLAYRSISDTYDTWSWSQMRTYISDLVMFGTNQIEMVAPDQKPSPHFTVADPVEMITSVSSFVDNLQLRFSLWWPLAATYEPSGGDLFQRLARLDSLFIPGGDGSPINPGPRQFLELCAAQANYTNSYFPITKNQPPVEYWVSAQMWNATQMSEFYSLLQFADTEYPWLTGVVYSPHQSDTIQSARARVPQRLAMRHYPDICHATKAELPNFLVVFAIVLHSSFHFTTEPVYLLLLCGVCLMLIGRGWWRCSGIHPLP